MSNTPANARAWAGSRQVQGAPVQHNVGLGPPSSIQAWYRGTAVQGGAEPQAATGSLPGWSEGRGLCTWLPGSQPAWRPPAPTLPAAFPSRRGCGCSWRFLNDNAPAPSTPHLLPQPGPRAPVARTGALSPAALLGWGQGDGSAGGQAAGVPLMPWEEGRAGRCWGLLELSPQGSCTQRH